MLMNRPRLFALLVLWGVLSSTWVGCADNRSRGEAPSYTTNIYIADLADQDGLLELTGIAEVTRREGYDNQPVFLSDGRTLLYASRRGAQVDIYRYDLETGAREAVLETPEREYLPSPIPEADGISVVRVEKNGKQRLWRFDLQGGEPELLFDSPILLRYYVWTGPQTAVTVDGELDPNLFMINVGEGTAARILSGVGRSLQRIPGRAAVSFVHKVADDEWWIKELDLETRRVRPLVLARPGSEDFTWTPDGLLLMGQGSRIFQWRPAPGAGWDDWQVVVDLSLQGLFDVTRLAVSPDGTKLALVNRESRDP
jgi:hypothetical protein